MKAFILAVLLTFAPYHADTESFEERRSRLGVVAEAIDRAAGGDAGVAAFLVMTAHRESRLAQHVHEGRCRQGECDDGRAASLWQIQHGPWLPKVEWERMKGVDLAATERAARYAAGIYRRGLNRCKTTKGAISLYATGRTCYWEGRSSRARRLQKIQAQLR